MSTLLDVKGLTVEFPTSGGTVRAVEDFDLSLNTGETLALVGESGSGKSTAALALLGLIPEAAGRITSGEILFEARDLRRLSPRELRKVRGSRVGMIFQDPMVALNPVFPIGWQVAEPLRLHFGLSESAARKRVIELLDRVGIPAPDQRVDQYPHNLSGGMRQRAMIATALACRPSLLIADEPTTALDVTVQAQVLELINDLKKEFGMAVLLITHDLSVVWETAQQIVVMYAGRKVEEGGVSEIFSRPAHPYTRGLLEAAKWQDQPGGLLREIRGTVPSPLDLPAGCRFSPRCDYAVAQCSAATPPMIDLTPTRGAACVRARELLQ
jgi:oligopeptide/dipeptide ABC transporter ATP-binding protein